MRFFGDIFGINYDSVAHRVARWPGQFPIVTRPPHARMTIGVSILTVSLVEPALIHRLGNSEAPMPLTMLAAPGALDKHGR